MLTPVSILNICYNVKNIIHTKKSINNLVIDKFISYNRIASNVNKNIFYISLQCLLTGNCFVPQYLQNIDNFISIINGNKYLNDKTKNNYKIIFDEFNL